MSFTHMDEEGKLKMVGISDKKFTKRTAIAAGKILLKSETIRMLREKALPKGDVLATAQISGIQGAKRTDELIPLCHQIPLDLVQLKFDVLEDSIEIEASCIAVYKTGVEMEALTAVSIAALTIYDMCKAVDKEMRIEGIRLLKKVKEDL